MEALARPTEVAARVTDLLGLNTRYSNFIDTFEAILSQQSTQGILAAVAKATQRVLGLKPGSVRLVVSDPRIATLYIVHQQAGDDVDSALHGPTVVSAIVEPAPAPRRPDGKPSAPGHGPSAPASGARSLQSGTAPIAITGLASAKGLKGRVSMTAARELLTFRMRNLSEVTELDDAIASPRAIARTLKYEGGAAAKAYTRSDKAAAARRLSRKPGDAESAAAQAVVAAATGGGSAPPLPAQGVDGGSSSSAGDSGSLGRTVTASTARSSATDPDDWVLAPDTGLSTVQARVILAAANERCTAFATMPDATEPDLSHGQDGSSEDEEDSDLTFLPVVDGSGAVMEGKVRAGSDSKADAAPRPVRSTLAAPILDVDAARMYGVLEIHSDDPDQFVASDKHLLEAFASTAARCIRGVGLLVATRTAVRRSAKLLSMTRHALSEDDLGNVVKRIVETGYELVPADRVSVFLVDREAEELVLIVSEDAAGIHMPLGKGIAGAVATSGRPENIPDAYLDLRFNQAIDKATHYRTKSVVAVPVQKADGEVIAVIQAINRTDDEPFNAEDQSMLMAVANAAAVALTQARLLREAQDETDKALALVEAGAIIEQAERRSSDLYQMLNDLVSRVASRLVPSDKMTLFLVDEIKGDLVFRVTKDEGEGLKDLRIPVGFGIAGAVAASGRVENIPDAYQDTRFTQEVDRKTGYRTRSMLVVPIVDPNSKRVVAVLQAINKRGGGRFTRTDEKIFQSFAANIASSISKRVMQAAYDRVMGDDGSAQSSESALERSLLSQFLNRSESTATSIPSTAAAPPGSTKSRARRRSVAWNRGGALERLRTDGSVSSSIHGASMRGGPIGAAASSASIAVGAGASGTSVASSPRPGSSRRPSDATSGGGAAMPMSPPPSARGSVTSPTSAGATSSALTSAAHGPASPSGSMHGNGSQRTLSRIPSAEAMEAAAAGAHGPEAADAAMAAAGDWPGALIGGAVLKSARLAMPDGPVPFRGAWAGRMTKLSFNTLAQSDADLSRCVLDMCYDLGLIQFFHLDSRKVLRFATELSVRYRDNPYHNFAHGVSVAHISFFVASRCEAATRLMSEIDRLALILGSAAHDVEHPGWNNAFEVATMSPLAIRYNDQSVLENHHAATMFRILDTDGTDLGSDLLPETFMRFRKVALRGIMATDMAHHGKLVEKARLLTPDIDASFPGDEISRACTLAEFVMHTADVCNPALPAFEVVKDWAERVCQEFTNQAELEQSHGMSPAPHMVGLDDEHLRAKSQAFFGNSIVRPLYASVAVALPELTEMVENIDRNVLEWKRVIAETKPAE